VKKDVCQAQTCLIQRSHKNFLHILSDRMHSEVQKKNFFFSNNNSAHGDTISKTTIISLTRVAKNDLLSQSSGKCKTTKRE
jgi:hypothetical protein